MVGNWPTIDHYIYIYNIYITIAHHHPSLDFPNTIKFQVTGPRITSKNEVSQIVLNTKKAKSSVAKSHSTSQNLLPGPYIGWLPDLLVKKTVFETLCFLHWPKLDTNIGHYKSSRTSLCILCQLARHKSLVTRRLHPSQGHGGKRFIYLAVENTTLVFPSKEHIYPQYQVVDPCWYPPMS